MNVLTFPGSMSICYQNKKYKSFIGRKQLELSPFSPVFRRPPGSLKKEFPICSSRIWGWLCSCTWRTCDSRYEPQQCNSLLRRRRCLSLDVASHNSSLNILTSKGGGKNNLPTKSPQHLSAFLPSCSCNKINQKEWAALYWCSQSASSTTKKIIIP